MKARLRQWIPLFGLQLVLLIAFYTTWPSRFLQDEAYVVLGARAILGGELPYKDWSSYLSPGSYCLAVPWMAVFGTGQFGTRSLMAVVAAAQGVVVWELAAPLSRSWRWFAWCLWATMGMLEIPILNYHWLSVFFYSLAVLAARRWVSGAASAGIATGCLVALAGWTLQSEGLAGVVLLVLCALCYRPPGVGKCALALLLTSLALWAPFLPWTDRIVEQSVLALRAHQRWNAFPYSWKELTPTLEAARASLFTADPPGTCYIWLLYFWRALKFGALPGMVAVAVVFSWRRGPRDLQVLVLALVSLAWANKNRQTLHYFSYLLPLAWPLLASLLSRLPRATWPRNLLTLLALTFWSLHTLLWWRDQRLPIDTPAGRYWSDDPYQQQLYSILGRWAVRAGSDPRGALCQVYQPHLYSLWFIRVPVAQIVIQPVQSDEQVMQEAARRLDEQQVPWILWIPSLPELTAQEHPGVTAEEYGRLQERCYQILTANYVVVEQVDVLQLLHRRPGRD